MPTDHEIRSRSRERFYKHLATRGPDALQPDDVLVRVATRRGTMQRLFLFGILSEQVLNEPQRRFIWQVGSALRLRHDGSVTPLVWDSGDALLQSPLLERFEALAWQPVVESARNWLEAAWELPDLRRPFTIGLPTLRAIQHLSGEPFPYSLSRLLSRMGPRLDMGWQYKPPTPPTAATAAHAFDENVWRAVRYLQNDPFWQHWAIALPLVYQADVTTSEDALQIRRDQALLEILLTREALSRNKDDVESAWWWTATQLARERLRPWNLRHEHPGLHSLMERIRHGASNRDYRPRVPFSPEKDTPATEAPGALFGSLPLSDALKHMTVRLPAQTSQEAVRQLSERFGIPLSAIVLAPADAPRSRSFEAAALTAMSRKPGAPT